MKTIRILIIEDNRLLRDGIVAMLRKHRGLKVIRTSGNGKESLLKVHRMRPNVILLDVGLRSQNSLRLVWVVKREFPNAKVVVMDLAPVEADITQFVNAGASGFILKEATPDDFVTTIRAVAGGTDVLPAMPAASLFSEIVGQAVRAGKAELKDALRMTPRERFVIRLLADGKSHREIAQGLRGSTAAVRSHLHNIMEKLALHTRLEAVRDASAEGSLKAIAERIAALR
jgi:DNA-binding NarL/FixJ family response regulator